MLFGVFFLAIDENIYIKILADSEKQRRFISAEDVDEYLQEVLGDCYNHLKTFYLSAFKNCIEVDGTYIVFVARRCAVLGGLFLRAFENQFTKNEFQHLQDNIYTDAGFRALVANIAKECYKDFSYNCFVNLYDDILIHGRAIGGLLSSAEDVFIKKYQQLRDMELDEEKKCSSTVSEYDLVTKFLNMVHIQTATQSKYTLLLNQRYVLRIENNGFADERDVTEANEWRKRSYRCADAIFNSDVPNACFVPHIKINQQGKEVLRGTFLNNKVNNSRFDCVTTQYKKRSLDTYTWLLPATNKAKAIFTVRCTSDYLIPFAFLPACSSLKMKQIENSIINKLQCSDFVGEYFEKSNELLCLLKAWSEFEAISVLYTEVIDLIFSLTVLKLFLNELNECEQCIDGVDFELIKNNTNIKNIMFNFAHEKLIEELIVVLLDPKFPPIFTYEEIEELICGCTDEEQYIVNDISIITKELRAEDRVVIDTLEEAAFLCGSKSELEAYSLSNSSFIPCRRSILMLRFPVKNSIEAFLNSVYLLHDSWCCYNAPLKYVISYILQFMDAGVLAVSTGRDKDRYILSVRPGEQSLVTLPMRYAKFIPLMKEIEDRCMRQGRTPKSSFDVEFEYFLMLLRKDDCYGNVALKEVSSELMECESDLKRLAEFFYSSGQSFGDYIFTLNEYYRELGNDCEMNSQKQIERCKSLYDRIIY